MQKRLVKDLGPNEEVSQIFLVKFKQLRTARSGSLFIHCELADKTGAITARMWNASRAIYDTFEENALALVRGTTELYQSNLQLIIESIRPVRPEEADISDFLPVTTKNVDELLERIKGIVQTMENVHLKALLEAFLADETFVEKLKKAPAAVEYHHAFIGGLIEHTTSILEMGTLAAEHYPELNRDVLLTGIFLHDIGKVDELAYDTGFSYTNQGGLIGHLVGGVLMLEEKARVVPDFPEELLNILRHIILSHHGVYEYGSPKLPMTTEAMAVHHLDNLDAKINAFNRIITSHPHEKEKWTEWSKMFERRLYRGMHTDSGEDEE
jgi:3'-5' exoribonuclease